MEYFTAIAVVCLIGLSGCSDRDKSENRSMSGDAALKNMPPAMYVPEHATNIELVLDEDSGFPRRDLLSFEIPDHPEAIDNFLNAVRNRFSSPEWHALEDDVYLSGRKIGPKGGWLQLDEVRMWKESWIHQDGRIMYLSIICEDINESGASRANISFVFICKEDSQRMLKDYARAYGVELDTVRAD